MGRRWFPARSPGDGARPYGARPVEGRAGVVVLAALAPAAVLTFDPWGLYPFGPAKWLVVSLAVPLGAALLLGARPLRVATRPTAALGALLAVLAIAAAFGRDPLYAWTGTPERHLGVWLWLLVLVAFIAGQALRPDDDGPRVHRGLLLAGTAVGAAGTIEALGLAPAPLDAGSRLGATLGSPAFLGAAACLLLPPLVTTALDRAAAHRRLVVGGTVLLGVVGLGAGARAAWLGLLVAVVASRRHRRDPAPDRKRRLAGALVVALSLVAVVAVTAVGDRVADTFDTNEPGGASRVDEWRVATRVIADHPLLGVGPEGYRVAFGEGADDDYEREHGRQPLPDRAHSAPLDLALAGGVPALVAWLALLAFVGRHIRRALADDRPWLRGIASGLVAYGAGQLLLFPLAELEPVAALLAGLVVAATATPRELRSRPAPRVLRAGLVAVAIVALVAGALDVRADQHADRAYALLAAGNPAAADAEAVRAAELRPDEVRLHLLVSQTALAADRGTVGALAAIDDALAVSPGDPIALRTRARLLVQRAAATAVPAHAQLAVDEVERLLADDPSNGLLHLIASFAYDLVGDEATAQTHLDRARDLGAAPAGDGT